MSAYPLSESFWSASESWYRARQEAQRKAKGLGSLRAGEDLSAKAAAWGRRVSAGKLARYRVRALPGQLIRVDPALQRELLNLAERAMPETVRALDEHLGPLARRAFDAWPVSSGLSKSLIALEYDVTSEGNLRATLRNRAPYVFFIKGQPHRSLLDQPFRSILPRIGEQILASLAAGGRRGP